MSHDTRKNVASARINRSESGELSVAMGSCQLWSRWHEASGNLFGRLETTEQKLRKVNAIGLTPCGQ